MFTRLDEYVGHKKKIDKVLTYELKIEKNIDYSDHLSSFMARNNFRSFLRTSRRILTKTLNNEYIEIIFTVIILVLLAIILILAFS